MPCASCGIWCVRALRKRFTIGAFARLSLLLVVLVVVESEAVTHVRFAVLNRMFKELLCRSCALSG
jgi:hypothetical protein